MHDRFISNIQATLDLQSFELARNSMNKLNDLLPNMYQYILLTRDMAIASINR